MGLNVCENPNDFSLTNYLTGTSVTLSDFDGKVILLSFVCIRCGWCWAWMEHMQQIQDDYETDPDVQVVGVIYNLWDAADGMGHSGPVDSAWITDKLTDYGLTITFPLLMDGPYAGSVSQQYLGGFPGTVGFPYSYMISKNFLIANKWHRLSASAGEPVCFDSGDMTDTEYFVRHRLDDLKKSRTAWDTVLVLDYSGSMGSNVTIHGVAKPKIDFLREAAGTLMKVWKDYALCDDRIGLVYFQSNATTDGALVPILPGDNVETLISDITSKADGGCTAMGAGLATGLDILESSSHRRFVILFSDGMQNRNPLVYIAAITYDGATCYERHIDTIAPADYPDPLTNLCGGNAGQSDYAGPLPVVLEGIDVPIHTIGIGAPAPWQAMLNHVALASFGQFRMDVDIWPNLKEFFLEDLVEIYRGSSLQVVKKKTGVLEGETRSEAFVLNKSVKKVTVLLSWLSENSPLSFYLRKDGRNVRLDHKITEENTYRFATLSFPHYQKSFGLSGLHHLLGHAEAKRSPARLAELPVGLRMESDIVEPEGDWEIVIRRTFPGDQAPASYHLMVLADDSKLEYIFEVPREIQFSGVHIPVTARVFEDGEPLESIYSVDAVIRRPIAALGNILAGFKGEKPAKRSDRDDSPPCEVAAMLEAALRDKKTAASLRNVEISRMGLAPVWKERREKRRAARGLFRGFYKETKTPGMYRIDLTVRGVGKNCGVFERTESRTVLIQPKPDKAATAIRATYAPKAGRLALKVTPSDKFGNMVGPGYSGEVRVEVDGKPLAGVADNLDGSYGVDIKAPDKKRLTRMNMKVAIFGFTVFEGSPEVLIRKPGSAK